MKNKVSYEWTFDELNDDGDIVDSDGVMTLSERPNLRLDNQLMLALTRNVGNDIDGLLERSYAYVDTDTMTLPHEFDDGYVVPQKYRLELMRWLAAQE